MTMTETGMIVSHLVLWIVVLCLSAALYVLAKHVGMLHIRTGNTSARVTNRGPALGSRVPAVRLTGVDGRHVVVGGLKANHTLLLFLTPGCFNCGEMAPAFRNIDRNERHVDLILVGQGEEEANRRYQEEHRLSHLQMVCSSELHALFGITGTPHAVLLDPEGAVLTKGVVNTAVHLESVLNAIDAEPASAKTEDAAYSSAPVATGKLDAI